MRAVAVVVPPVAAVLAENLFFAGDFREPEGFLARLITLAVLLAMGIAAMVFSARHHTLGAERHGIQDLLLRELSAIAQSAESDAGKPSLERHHRRIQSIVDSALRLWDDRVQARRPHLPGEPLGVHEVTLFTRSQRDGHLTIAYYASSDGIAPTSLALRNNSVATLYEVEKKTEAFKLYELYERDGVRPSPVYIADTQHHEGFAHIKERASERHFRTLALCPVVTAEARLKGVLVMASHFDDLVSPENRTFWLDVVMEHLTRQIAYSMCRIDATYAAEPSAPALF